MWPFKQPEPDEENNLPEEVKQYYETERREHIGVAWLLAFVTLVLTVAVIIGLFLGGRWTYRKIAHKNTTHTSSQTATNTKAQPAATPQSSSNTQTSTNSSSSPATKAPATTNPSTTTPATTSSPAATSTPASSASQSLTNTGPGDTVALFIGVTALATVSHLIYSRRKLAKTLA